MPALKRKFGLLRSYSSRTSWSLLAEPFGAAAKTLQYWCDGNQTRSPDQIPPEALPVLLKLFAEILPRSLPAEEVRRLVLGPADRLEAELRSGAAASFAALIAREGQTGTGVLFRKSAESGLIEVEGETAPADCARVALWEWFRVRFPVPAACRYAVTLQNVQQAWAVVPSVLMQGTFRRVLVPGLENDSAPRFMRERRDPGLHRFVCLQAGAPFPPLVEEHAREGLAFDQRGLETLARFYEDLPVPQRACHVLIVVIEPEASP